MAAAKRGRPRTSATGEARTTSVYAYLTASEHAAVERYAEAQGLAVSEYLRRAAAYCGALAVPLARVTVGPLPAGLEVE